MTSEPSNYHREYSPDGSYSLFQFERSGVISVVKNSTEYSFVFFKCLVHRQNVFTAHNRLQFNILTPHTELTISLKEV